MPPRSNFLKTQLAWQGVKLTQLMSIVTSKKVWKFLIQIHLTKSNPKITRGVKMPCPMAIRVKSANNGHSMLKSELCQVRKSCIFNEYFRLAAKKEGILYQTAFGLCLPICSDNFYFNQICSKTQLYQAYLDKKSKTRPKKDPTVAVWVLPFDHGKYIPKTEFFSKCFASFIIIPHPCFWTESGPQ